MPHKKSKKIEELLKKKEELSRVQQQTEEEAEHLKQAAKRMVKRE